MGDGSLIEIVLFAMVAAFLFIRLRNVLGRRTGNERQRPDPIARPVPDPRGDNVLKLPDRGDGARADIDGIDLDKPPAEVLPVAAGLAQIKSADPGFSEDGFLSGARGAFEMIVDSYARGDLQTLRPLLADDVYERFATAVKARQAAGESLETRIERVESVDVAEARMDGRTAIVTVRVVSEQVNVTRDRAGAVLDGDPAKPEEVIDLWTFARNTKSRDPNWVLVATRTPS